MARLAGVTQPFGKCHFDQHSKHLNYGNWCDHRAARNSRQQQTAMALRENGATRRCRHQHLFLFVGAGDWQERGSKRRVGTVMLETQWLREDIAGIA